MTEFWQTLMIAVIPSTITAFLSFWASSKSSTTQIKAIQEQNKADIEKLVEQNKVDIEALKEKHQLEMQAREKDYYHQIELIKLQHKNELQKDEESVKNQVAANAVGSILGGIFSEQSPIANKLNEAISSALEEAMNEKN